MRFLACGAFTWAATVAFDRNLPIIFWTSVALTILYNPIIDLYISSQIWIALDLISAAFLLLIHKRIQEHPSQPYRTT
ncbi:hypothetical protein BCU68_01215 [Vibrio sp. 10N.286.49.B3]|nr:hypothetical protein BCU68_01215 [Vibrio sp. 10N.286.49.B3]